jgi:hypothetical protein
MTSTFKRFKLKSNLVTSIFRLVVSAQEFAGGSTDITEFGADEQLVALTLPDLTKKLFVGATSIHICRSHIDKRRVFVFVSKVRRGMAYKQCPIRCIPCR